MSQYKVPDPYDLIECPYEKSHMVDAKRFQRHLQKCGKQHPNAKVKKCPYNARHVVAEQTFRHHVANCPDRATLLPDIKFQAKRDNGGERTFQGDCSVPAYKNWEPPSPEENWDNEVDENRVFFYGQSNHREEEYYDDEPEGPHIPVGLAPRDMPKGTSNQAGPSKIFEYSVKAAGVKAVSRERKGSEEWNSAPTAAPSNKPAPNPWAPPVMDNKNQENIAILQALGRGRGIGRGPKAGSQSPNVGANSQGSDYEDSPSQTQPSWAVMPSGQGTAQSGPAGYNPSSPGYVTEGNAVAASSALASQLQKRAVGRGRGSSLLTNDKCSTPAFSLGRGKADASIPGGMAGQRGGRSQPDRGTAQQPEWLGGRQPSDMNQQPGGLTQQAGGGVTQQPRGVTQQPRGITQPPHGVRGIGRAGPRPEGRSVNVANASGFSLGGRGAVKPSVTQPAPVQPAFIVPKVNGPSVPPGFQPSMVAGSGPGGYQRAQDVGSDGETISESASQTSTSDSSSEIPSSENGEDTKREIRKLQKKIREIEVLEMRHLSGGILEPEQITKISMRHELVAKMDALSLRG